MSPFCDLSRPTLLELASALKLKRLQSPYSAIKLSAIVVNHLPPQVVTELQRLDAEGMQARHIAELLHAISREREQTQATRDRSELVWTGGSDTSMRDTQAVVRNLFATTSHRLLISSYAIDRGQKGRTLLEPLAKRMDELAQLKVTFYLNINRSWRDTTSSVRLRQKFARGFRQLWPGQRLPQVYYDPRSLSENVRGQRACLHAKSVVSDEDRVLITSANFTQAAHTRNFEAGVLLTDPNLARALSAQFQSLVESGRLLPLEF